MLSNSAYQQIERYANIALSRSGHSSLQKNAKEANEPVNIWQFVTSSYAKQQTYSEALNDENNSSKAENRVINNGNNHDSMNIKVLMSTSLWSESQNVFLIASNSIDNKQPNAISLVSEVYLVAISLSISMIEYEVRQILQERRGAEGKIAVLSLDQKTKWANLLHLHIRSLNALGRHNCVESQALTMGFAMIVGAAADLCLALMHEKKKILQFQDSKDNNGNKLVDANTLYRLLYLAVVQLHRSSAAFPLRKLFTVRLLAQQVKSILSNSVGGKNIIDVNQIRKKIRLLPKLSLLFSLMKIRDVGEHSDCESSAESRLARKAIVSLISPYVNTYTSRYYVYFRGEAEEDKFTMYGCSDVAVESSAIAFASLPAMEDSVLNNLAQASPDILEAVSLIFMSWAASVEVIYAAFCSDPSWDCFAVEQRRRFFVKETAAKSANTKKSLREQEKLIQRQMQQRALEALEAAKSLERAGADEFGETESRVSNLSRAETELRSEMSATSYSSLTTFLSVVDSETVASSQRYQHESIDGNSNLPLILFEMSCFAIYHFMNIAKKTGETVIFTSEIRQRCWEAIGDMFFTVLEGITMQAETGVTLFSLPDDVQYNLGLGYQSLGMIFARIVVPVLLREDEDSIARDNANNKSELPSRHVAEKPIESDEEAIYVAQTLLVFERVAPQVINQNLVAVLNVCYKAFSCCRTHEDISGRASSQKMIVTSLIVRKRATFVLNLIQSIILRLGKANQLSLLLKVLLESGKPPQTKSLKLDSDTENDLDEGDDSHKNDPMTTTLNTNNMKLSPEAATFLLQCPEFRTAFISATRISMTFEVLFSDVTSDLEQVLHDTTFFEDDEEGKNGESKEASGARTAAVVSHFKFRIPMICGLLEILCCGFEPSSFTSFGIFEKILEVDSYLVHYVNKTLSPIIQRFKSGFSRESGKEGVQKIWKTVRSCEEITRANLRCTFLTVGEALICLRSTTLACLQDLDVDHLDQFIELMNETFWQFSVNNMNSLSHEKVQNHDDDDLSPPLMSYDRSLTIKTCQFCVPLKGSTEINTVMFGRSALSIFTKLAAQRLLLMQSVRTLLATNLFEEGGLAGAEGKEGHWYDKDIIDLVLFIVDNLKKMICNNYCGNEEMSESERSKTFSKVTASLTSLSDAECFYLAKQIECMMSSQEGLESGVQARDKMTSILHSFLYKCSLKQSEGAELPATFWLKYLPPPHSLTLKTWAYLSSFFAQVNGAVPHWKKFLLLSMKQLAAEARATTIQNKGVCACEEWAGVVLSIFELETNAAQELITIAVEKECIDKEGKNDLLECYDILLNSEFLFILVNICEQTEVVVVEEEKEILSQYCHQNQKVRNISSLLVTLYNVAIHQNYRINNPSTYACLQYISTLLRVISNGRKGRGDVNVEEIPFVNMAQLLLFGVPYLLPRGILSCLSAENEKGNFASQSRGALSSCIKLYKKIVKYACDGLNEHRMTIDDKMEHFSRLVSFSAACNCVGYLLSKHLPVYFDSADLAVKSSALVGSCGNLFKEFLERFTSSKLIVLNAEKSENEEISVSVALVQHQKLCLVLHLLASSLGGGEHHKNDSTMKLVNLAKEKIVTFTNHLALKNKSKNNENNNINNIILQATNNALSKAAALACPNLALAVSLFLKATKTEDSYKSSSQTSLVTVILDYINIILLRNSRSQPSLVCQALHHIRKMPRVPFSHFKTVITSLLSGLASSSLSFLVNSSSERTCDAAFFSEENVSHLFSVFSLMHIPLTALLGNSTIITTFVNACGIISGCLIKMIKSHLLLEAAVIASLTSTSGLYNMQTTTTVVGSSRSLSSCNTLNADLLLKSSVRILRSMLDTFGFIVIHNDKFLAMTSIFLPFVFRNMFQVIMTGLELVSLVKRMNATSSAVSVARTGEVNYNNKSNYSSTLGESVYDIDFIERGFLTALNSFSATLARIIKATDVDSVICSTPLSAAPQSTPAAFLSFSIATSLFSSISSGRQLALFSLYSNELDFFIKDLMMRMMNAPLATGNQELVFSVRKVAIAVRDKCGKRQRSEGGYDGDKGKPSMERVEEEEAMDSFSDNDEGEKKTKKANEEKHQGKEENEEMTLEEVVAAEIAADNTQADGKTGETVAAQRRKKNIYLRRKLSMTRVTARQRGHSHVVDLCFAALQSTDSQNLLRSERLRIRDDEGRTLFMPGIK